MDVIFDIKSDLDWASLINDEIQKEFPEYFSSNPVIGSAEWWELQKEDITNGKITHVGEVLEDGELLDIVVIQPLDENFDGDHPYTASQPEFSVYREDFWASELVKKDKLVRIKSITICPSGELDEHSIYLETEVCVW